MKFTLKNNGNTTFSVLDGTAVVFIGPLDAAMRECSKLNLAAKGPAKASSKEQKRQERKQAGVR